MSAVSEAERRRLRAWAIGLGSPPWWVEPLLMAEAWRVAPWEIVATAPVEWVDRWRALEKLRQDQQAVVGGSAKRVGGKVYHEVTGDWPAPPDST